MSAGSSGAGWERLARFRFGDGEAMANELLALVLAGRKTATCWPVRDGQQTEPGCRQVVLDGRGRPRAVVETLTLEQKVFGDVDAAFAHDEGEGDGSLEGWREGHRRYFERSGGYAPDMMLWCERFALVQVIPLPGEG